MRDEGAAARMSRAVAAYSPMLDHAAAWQVGGRRHLLLSCEGGLQVRPCLIVVLSRTQLKVSLDWVSLSRQGRLIPLELIHSHHQNKFNFKSTTHL